MGDWLKSTATPSTVPPYWSIGGAQEGDWRFTTKDGAFYVTALTQPNSAYTFSAPIPVIEGDTVTALADSSNVDYSIDPSGKLILRSSSQQVAAGSLGWSYKIAQQC